MKKISLALALAAASLLSSNAMAQAYVSGHFGMSDINADCSSCDTSDTAFKFLGGYGFGNGFSGEVAYVDYGKVSGNGGSLKVSGFTFGGAYALPLDKQWDLNLRLGLANLKVKGFGESESDTNPYFGFGVSYAVNKQLKIEANAEFTRASYNGDDGSVRSYTIGARYSF